MMSIETARIALRPFTAADAPRVAAVGFAWLNAEFLAARAVCNDLCNTGWSARVLTGSESAQ